LANVKHHFIHNGRDHSFKVWKGPRNIDSSNEEWEEELKITPIGQPTLELDLTTDV